MAILANQGRPDLTGWGIGQWGMMPWDSSKLPGNIDTNLIAYNLRIENLNLYPSSGWIAEIQTRNLLDKVNHTFKTYAKLDQILEDGNLTTLAGIFLLQNIVYLSCIVSKCSPSYVSPTSYRISPIKVVLYRLDNVENNIGIFTLVGIKELNITSGAIFGKDNDYAPGPVVINAGGAEGRTQGRFNPKLTYNYLNINDYNGPRQLIQSWTIEADAWLCPFTPDLNALKVSFTQWQQGRLVTVSTYINDPKLSENPGGYFTIINKAKRTFNYTGINGVGDIAHEENENLSWDSSMQDAVYLYRTGSFLELPSNTNGYNKTPNFAHPASFTVDCNFAIFWGKRINNLNYEFITGSSGTTWVTDYLVDQETKTVTNYSAITNVLGLYETLVGIWGINASAIFVKKNTSIINHDKFYVCKSSDINCVNKYSIFSTVQEDGKIIHIEGLEDITPTFWEDETFLININ